MLLRKTQSLCGFHCCANANSSIPFSFSKGSCSMVCSAASGAAFGVIGTASRAKKTKTGRAA
jgi:hypothetical protein